MKSIAHLRIAFNPGDEIDKTEIRRAHLSLECVWVRGHCTTEPKDKVLSDGLGVVMLWTHQIRN